MKADPGNVILALDRRYLLDFPRHAAQRIVDMSVGDAADVLRAQSANTIVPLMAFLPADVAAAIVQRLDETQACELLAELAPNDAARLLLMLGDATRARYLSGMTASVANEFERVLDYPRDSAGRLMDARIPHFRASATVEETLRRLREVQAKANRSLFLIDDDNRLCGRVTIQDVALAEPDTRLEALLLPVSAVATQVMPREEVVELLERHKLVDLPVVDIDGHLLGVIFHDALIQAIHEDATVDMQTMVGASRDERALSPPLFAVRKRLPWLQINLLTAFLAAAVVGIFEETIAMFTALAVLLPVVAGQSGNAGAQALAVTMRGLALREISLRNWFQVTAKEIQAGLANGIAVAVTCGIGVYLWSGSVGLVLVIAMSMVLAMVAAGFSGAIVPIALTRLGQDPAQSSSIVLTTITDVTGFLSFLGIATLLSGML